MTPNASFPLGDTKRIAQIEGHGSQVAINIQALATYARDSPWGTSPVRESGWNSVDRDPAVQVPGEVHQARRSILAHMGQLQILLEEPADFLQRLARQNQLLACLRWLIEYQVLACIPLQGSVPISEVAALTDAPEKRLAQIVQMTATSGFLCEPKPGQLAHTALSVPFVSDLNLLDASLFLTETAAPAAYEMATATRRWGPSAQIDQTAYNAAFDTPTTFFEACEQGTRLRRQWSAYLLCGMGDVEAGVRDVLTRLNWSGLGNSIVVDTAATSATLATTLAKIYPSLRFIVQLSNTHEPNDNYEMRTGHIVIEQRVFGTPQHVRDAALFIARVPTLYTTASISAHIRTELQAHVGVLNANRRARLLLVLPSVLRDHTWTGDSETEAVAMARLRDLAFWQLAKEGEMEMSELLDLANGVHDGGGKLAVVNKFAARHHSAFALELRYQSYTEVEA
ncbi:hypothetical protein F4680DRAFT_453588 [Xylaria scruposa]|nr:hypothetical protein F4680DRAFT_453588 [Xylaria scruposa]